MAAFVAVAAAIAATAFHLGHDATRPADRPSATASQKDRLGRELARCRAIGVAAEDDAGCAAAWAETRRRFFSYAPPSDPSQPANEKAFKPNTEAR